MCELAIHYGWTLDYIRSLTFSEVTMARTVIEERQREAA